MILTGPVTGVVGKKIAYRLAALSIEVQSRTPRCYKIRVEVVLTKLTQIIAIWAKVIKNCVENYCKATGVSSIHQPPQGLRAAIGLSWRKQADTIITPVALT